MASMIVPGEIARFRLSSHGATALNGMTRGLNEGVVQALVIAVDALGVWIQSTESEALLLKWEHFSTAIVDIPQEQPKPTRRIGF